MQKIEGQDDGVVLHLESGKQVKDRCLVVGEWSFGEYGGFVS